MVEKFIDPCCEKCTHTAGTPCRDFVVCRLEGPLCHESRACGEMRRAIVEKVALNEKFVIS